MKAVSVVMCTYNASRYLEEQLLSILNQTYPICEILIQDDNSEDETAVIVESYMRKYPVISFRKNKYRLGPHLNFANVFYFAKGNYIAVSDQDDIWYPNKVEKLVSKIDQSVLVISNSTLFGDLEGSIFSSPPNVNPVAILLKNCVVGHTSLFRKDLLPVDRSLWDNGVVSYDAFLGFLASSKGEISYVDECLTLWRRHNNTVSGREKRRKKLGIGILGYYNSICSLFNRKQKELVRKYFLSILPIFESNEELYPIVYYLANNSLFNLIKCSFFCLRFSKELNPNIGNPLVRYIRAFFFPLFRFRDVIAY